MIAKQIEPPGFKITYSETGRLIEVSGGQFRWKDDLLFTAGVQWGDNPQHLDELVEFADAIRHLREPEGVSESVKKVGQDNSPKGIQISPNESKDLDKDAAKDLEEAIELLREAIGRRPEMAALHHRIDAFLSRVGGDNE